MNVLITGANGLLASNVIVQLIKNGHSVRAMLRDEKNFIDFKHPNLSFIVGDITNYNDLELAINGSDYVIHAAAITSLDLLYLTDYHETNVLATKNIIELCIKNNVKRLVYVSSATCFGYGSLNNLGDESKTIKYPMSKMFYSLSKKEAHILVNNSSKELNVITVCPSFMIGTYDTKPSSGKIILMGLKKVIFCPPGGKNFINVKDAANGVISALKNGECGQSYILSNENLSYKEFFKKVIKQSKSKSLIVPIPKGFLFIGGVIGEILRFFKIKTSISIASLNALTVKTYFTNAKAKKELKIDFSPIEEGISEAIEWFESRSRR